MKSRSQLSPEMFLLANNLKGATAAHTENPNYSFMLALQFALLSLHVHPDAKLIRWTVKDPAGPKNQMHWAVLWKGGHAVDMLRQKVDGRHGLLHLVSEYPMTYTDVRYYPVAEIALAASIDLSSGRLDLKPSVMRSVLMHLARSDFAHARRQRGTAGGFGAVVDSFRLLGQRIVLDVFGRLLDRRTALVESSAG